MLGTFLLATSGFSWLHNSWYYLGFFSLLIHLVRILWVSSFLRLLLVLLRGDDILQLSSIRVVTVSCRMWSWLRLGSRYISSWVLCRQGDLLLVHYICVFIGLVYAIADLIGPDSWFSIRFCGYDHSNDLACEQTLMRFFYEVVIFGWLTFSTIKHMFRLMFVYYWNDHISFDME